MATDLKQRILAFVKENPGASFAHLCRALPECAGEASFGPLSRTDVVYWIMSEEAINAVASLVRDGQLHYKITTRTIYEIDGGVLTLPEVRSAHKYSTPHWLPVILCEGPPEIGVKKAKRR